MTRQSASVCINFFEGEAPSRLTVEVLFISGALLSLQRSALLAERTVGPVVRDQEIELFGILGAPLTEVPNLTACVRSIFHGTRPPSFVNHAPETGLFRLKLRSSPSRLKNTGGVTPFGIRFAQSGAWLCGVAGAFVSRFVSIAVQSAQHYPR